MFIDTLNERYPDRILAHLELEHSGFQVVFKVSQKDSLELSINIYELNERLEMYEMVREYERGRIHFTQADNHVIDGNMLSTLPILKGYLQTAIGGIEHTYEGSFVGWWLEQQLRRQDIAHCYTCQNEPTVQVETYLVHNNDLQSRRVWCQSCYDREYSNFNDESHEDVREIIYIKVAKLEIVKE